MIKPKAAHKKPDIKVSAIERIDGFELPLLCPNCSTGVVILLKGSDTIYGKNYGPLWVCSNHPKRDKFKKHLAPTEIQRVDAEAVLKSKSAYRCDSFVGCHPNTMLPLGTLANQLVRTLRKDAHAAFDILWKLNEKVGIRDARRKTYMFLANEMKIPLKNMHISQITQEQLVKCISIINETIKRVQ